MKYKMYKSWCFELWSVLVGAFLVSVLRLIRGRRTFPICQNTNSMKLSILSFSYIMHTSDSPHHNNTVYFKTVSPVQSSDRTVLLNVEAQLWHSEVGLSSVCATLLYLLQTWAHVCCFPKGHQWSVKVQSLCVCVSTVLSPQIGLSAVWTGGCFWHCRRTPGPCCFCEW